MVDIKMNTWLLITIILEHTLNFITCMYVCTFKF